MSRNLISISIRNLNIAAYLFCAMEALLDTNFIISCMKEKIDFMSQLEQQGFTVVLPREVFQELKDLKMKVSHRDREAVSVALTLFASKRVKKMTLGKNSVDKGLIMKGKQGYYIATLDASIRNMIPRRIIISRASKTITVINS